MAGAPPEIDTRVLNPRPRTFPGPGELRPPLDRRGLNWRDHASLDGYFFAYNWSGTISVSDNVPVAVPPQTFSSVIAASPQNIDASTAIIIKNGSVQTVQSANDGSLTANLCQVRLTELTRAQHCRIMKPQPQLSLVLLNLLRVLCSFDETDLNPVFFAEDFNGGPGGATTAQPFIGAPLQLEFNRAWTNSAAAIKTAVSQVVFDIDFYQRDPMQYGRRV